MITLKEIYEECIDLGMVESQTEFSEFLGRKPSWYSSTIAHGRGLNMDALHRITWALHDTYIATLIDLEDEQDTEQRQSYERGIEALEHLMGRVQDEVDRIMNQ